MTYVKDKTWAELASEATAAGTTAREALIHAKEAYEEFIRFRDGRSDATIAADLTALQPTGAPTITAAMVADLSASHQSSLEAYNFVTNVANPVQGDRMFGWRKFS